MKLMDKVAIVTGGGQGIGRAIAQKFADESARVFIGDMNKVAAAGTTVALREKGKNVCWSSLDIANAENVAGFVRLVLKEFGRIDILVNNAGIIRDNFLSKMPEEDFDEVMRVNAKGTMLMMQAVAPIMKEQEGGGTIINISSVVARAGNKGQVNYIASKSAVEGMTRGVALEYAPKVRVNAIAPGFIKTSMTAGIPEKALEKIFARIPLGRFGETDEIADAALYLATATYVTGQVLGVNGGMHLG